MLVLPIEPCLVANFFCSERGQDEWLLTSGTGQKGTFVQHYTGLPLFITRPYGVEVGPLSFQFFGQRGGDVLQEVRAVWKLS